MSMSSVSHNIFDNSFITSFDPKLRAGVRAKTRGGKPIGARGQADRSKAGLGQAGAGVKG